MTGLRLTREGISSVLFRQRFDIELMDLFGDEIDELVRLGLLEWYESFSTETCPDKCLRLTSKGKLLGNQVFMRFVGD